VNQRKLDKYLFNIFLFIFFLVGIYLAINTGITHDEFHDFYVFKANKNYIYNFLFGTSYDTSYLNGINKFYGSGFHYLSSILEIITKNLVFLEIENNESKIILSKHVTVFLFFLFSGLFLKKIIKIITKNDLHAKLSAIIYLTYPYLLGHSFFNVKDIPFLSIWIICTYFIIKILKLFFFERKKFKKELSILILLTAYLLSIRITGLLIFIQYVVFIIMFANLTNTKIIYLLKNNLKQIIFFCLFTPILFILLQPSFWNNPLLVIDAIKAMSQHLQTACTVTLRECMPAQDLPSTYLPIWFFFKTPLIIIFGLLTFFIIEERLKNKKLEYIVITSFILSTLAILILLILLNVNLYDEIRQVMFLLPGIFIISLSCLFFWSKKIFKYLSIFLIIFFILQNIKIYPYNYVWINNFSHITKINNVFELDYWGVSTRNVGDYIKKNNLDNTICIISNRNSGLEPFVSKKQCFIDFKNLHKPNTRPFYAIYMERSLKKGTPNKCNLIYEETKNINFSDEKVVFAKIYRCD